MYSIGFLWFPVASFLNSVDFLELSHLSTESARFLWIPMDSYTTISMGSYRIPTDSYGFIRMGMDSCRTPSSSIPHNSPITSRDILPPPPGSRSQLMLYMMKRGIETPVKLHVWSLASQSLHKQRIAHPHIHNLLHKQRYLRSEMAILRNQRCVRPPII